MLRAINSSCLMLAPFDSVRCCLISLSCLLFTLLSSPSLISFFFSLLIPASTLPDSFTLPQLFSVYPSSASELRQVDTNEDATSFGLRCVS